jgi:hypothetical protein
MNGNAGCIIASVLVLIISLLTIYAMYVEITDK